MMGASRQYKREGTQRGQDDAPYVVRRIGVVLSDGFSLLGAGVVAEAFHMAGEWSEGTRQPHVRYRLELLSREGGSVVCASSLKVWTERLDVSAVQTFDAIVSMSGPSRAGSSPGNAASDRLAPWLDDVLARRRIVRLSRAPSAPALAWPASGNGVANGPDNEVLYFVEASAVDDRAGLMGGVLALLGRDLGEAAARAISERLMPDAGQAGPFETDGIETRPARMRRLARWLRENCDRPVSIAQAAQEAAMSERNFLRCFKLEMRRTPSEYLLDARLEMSCRLLLATELPVDKIARRSGMGNGDHLAKLFRKRWSISPKEYRLRNRSGVHPDTTWPSDRPFAGRP
ncbi:AraC family transcriptional regulator [Burkholderia sp. WAC0059]|uniref:GlxA family transcriptional regulator n=1 Tax=Burkholderia sp. WAC0059 TaxID=2066022 RepID=UPI000C7F47BF|nr:helix-turn-helix domain-containing protein [Burkholderia sp. WAC0059]PLZ03568.1 AraC family transcriptional regulator [Burkholderia sp. WAC0059]